MEGNCYVHRKNAATFACDVCGRPICNVCMQQDAMRLTCPACVGDARRTRVAGKFGRWIVIAAVVAAAIVAVVLSMGGPITLHSRLDAMTTLAENPDDPDTLLAVGRYLRDNPTAASDVQRAMDALEKAHALRPDHGPTLVDLAYAFNADGRHSQAQDALQRAAKLGPLSDRGRALGDRMAQKMDRAATVATRQVDLTEKVAYEKAKRLADRQQNRMDLAVMKQENAALAHEELRGHHT